MTKQEAIDDLNWLTERLSNRVWTMCAGVIALSLAYIAESLKSEGAPFLSPRQVAIPAAIALFALLFDLLQYFCAVQQTTHLLRNMEKQKKNDLSFDSTNKLYRLRFFAYYCKMFFCFASVMWIIILSAFRVASIL